MSGFKDKDLGLILPTREGRATGSANERTLLEGVGGAAGVRTRVRVNADGSETMLRTRDGFPEFVTSEVPVVEDPKQPPQSFLGIPSSQAYQAGYSPVTSPEKIVHEWLIRTGGNPPPNSHSDSNSPRFKATYEYSDATADLTIGQHTWYSLSLKVARLPLVVSWKGPMWRSGNYASMFNGDKLVPSSLDTTARSSAVSVPGRAFEDNGAVVHTWLTRAQTGFDKAVWLNGVKIDTDALVWSAAVKPATGSDPSYLYYANELSIRRRKVKYKERYRGIERVPENPVLTTDAEAVVTTFDPYAQVIALFPDAVAIHLAQMPFINASCTKAVYLFHITDDLDNVAMVLFEGDFATGVLTEIMHTHEESSGMTSVGAVTADSQTATGHGTGNTTYSLTSGATFTTTPKTYHLVSPMAADYVGDALEYLYMESAHGVPGTSATLAYNDTATQTETVTIDGSGNTTYTWNFSLSISHSRTGGPTDAPILAAPAGVLLVSHLYGEVAKLDAPIDMGSAWASVQSCNSSGGYVRVFPPGGGGAISNTETNLDGDLLTQSYNRVVSSSSSEVQERAALVDADLRSRCYSFVLAFTTLENQVSYTESPGDDAMVATYGVPQPAQIAGLNPPQWSSVSTTLSRMKYATCVVAFGSVVFRSDKAFDYDWNAGVPYTVSGSGYGPVPAGLGSVGTTTVPGTDRPIALSHLHASPQFTPKDGFFYGASLPSPLWVHAPIFTSLAASAPKTPGGNQLAYMSVRFPDYGTLSGDEFHAFIKKSGGTVSVFDCSGIDYSPTGAANRTIVRPIFLPTRLPTK